MALDELDFLEVLEFLLVQLFITDLLRVLLLDSIEELLDVVHVEEVFLPRILNEFFEELLLIALQFVQQSLLLPLGEILRLKFLHLLRLHQFAELLEHKGLLIVLRGLSHCLGRAWLGHVDLLLGLCDLLLPLEHHALVLRLGLSCSSHIIINGQE